MSFVYLSVYFVSFVVKPDNLNHKGSQRKTQRYTKVTVVYKMFKKQ